MYVCVCVCHCVCMCVSQEIPLVNASDQYMVVNASLSGPSKAFSGGREISVPPSSTASYQLAFKPTVPGTLLRLAMLSLARAARTYRVMLVTEAWATVAWPMVDTGLFWPICFGLFILAYRRHRLMLLRKDQSARM